MAFNNEETIGEDEEYLLDEINGTRSKKPVMSILNKQKLSKQEMDELFLSEEQDYKQQMLMMKNE